MLHASPRAATSSPRCSRWSRSCHSWGDAFRRGPAAIMGTWSGGAGERRRCSCVVATLAACSAERQAPVAVPPPPPTTTTDRSRRRRAPRCRRRRLPTARPRDSSVPDASVEPIPTPATTDGVTTTTAAPAVDPWAVFDTQLAARLLDRGDYAVGVAVAVRGEIVHTADLGYRVAPIPAAPPPTSPADGGSVPYDSTSTPASSPPSAEPTTTTTGPVDFGGSGAAIAARGPLPDRQHQQGDHGDRRAAARGGRPARSRRRRRWATGRARRGQRDGSARRRRSPCVSCCRTPAGSRRTRARSSAAGYGSCQELAAYALGAVARRRAGHQLHLLEPQLLPARPACRADRRPPVRGRGDRPPARPAGHRLDAHGADVRHRPDVGGPPVRSRSQLHGGARGRRGVDGDTVGPREDPRLARHRRAAASTRCHSRRST